MAEATKRELREAARRERREREAGLARRKNVQQRGMWIVLAVVALALVAGAAYLLLQSSGPTVGTAMSDQGAGHVPEGTNLTFAEFPPTSGQHYPRTLERGFHDEEAAPGYWIHNLEHGYVVILYKCADDCPQLKEQLRQAYDTFPPSKFDIVKLIIVPDSQITTNLSVLAWNWKLDLDTFDREQILAFYNAHVDQGPEDVR